jgi:hypothetical protein
MNRKRSTDHRGKGSHLNFNFKQKKEKRFDICGKQKKSSKRGASVEAETRGKQEKRRRFRMEFKLEHLSLGLFQHFALHLFSIANQLDKKRQTLRVQTNTNIDRLLNSLELLLINSIYGWLFDANRCEQSDLFDWSGSEGQKRERERRFTSTCYRPIKLNSLN